MRYSGHTTTMAYIVSRRDGRFEIRESSMTPAGPRSSTLAIFSELSEQVLALASARANGSFSSDELRGRATTMGVPWVGNQAALTARRLIAESVSGRPPPPVFEAVLRATLIDASVAAIPPNIEPLLEWIGRSDEYKGRVIRDLLSFGDAFPPSRRLDRTLDYPRICSR